MEQYRPKGRSARSINSCRPMDEPWRSPAELMCRTQRGKNVVFGAARVYTVAVPRTNMEILV